MNNTPDRAGSAGPARMQPPPRSREAPGRGVPIGRVLRDELQALEKQFLPVGWLATAATPLRQLGLNTAALSLLRRHLEASLNLGLAEDWITPDTTLAGLYALLHSLLCGARRPRYGPATKLRACV